MPDDVRLPRQGPKDPRLEQKDPIPGAIKDFLGGLTGLQGDILAPPGSEPPSLPTMGGMALGAAALPFSQLIKVVKGAPQFRTRALRALEEALRAGEGKAVGWDPLTLDSFGGNAAQRQKFARFWGAVSPNTDTAMSNLEALRAHEADLRGQLPEVFSSLTMRGSKIPNLERAAQGIPLSSKGGQPGKVEAMARLLQGEDAIPIDVHALRGVGAAEEHYTQAAPAVRAAMGGGRPGYSKTYDTAAEMYQKALADVAPGVPTNVSFPQFWEGARALHGQSYLTDKPAEGISALIQRLGLGESGKMLDQKALEEALRRKF